MSKEQKEVTAVVQIPIAKLKAPALNSRQLYDAESLAELAESINRVGILLPLVVRKQNDEFEIIHGTRRALAAERAGLHTVPCIIEDRNDEEAALANVHENLFRKDLNPLEEGEFIETLMTKEKKSRAEITRLLCKSLSYIDARLECLYYYKHIKDALISGEMPLSIAKELARFDTEEVSEKFTDYWRKTGANTRTVAYWRQQYEASKNVPTLNEAQSMKPDTSHVEGAYGWNCAICRKFSDIAHTTILHFCPECAEHILTAIKR